MSFDVDAVLASLLPGHDLEEEAEREAATFYRELREAGPPRRRPAPVRETHPRSEEAALGSPALWARRRRRGRAGGGQA